MSAYKIAFSKGMQLSIFIIRFLDFASPVLDLAARFWVAHVFWKAGQLKVASWISTIYMFQYEYQVPLLPPEVAAVLTASVELGGSFLLAVGLAGRFAATALFVLNFMAVLSYPDLSPAGRTEHFYWGFLLVFLIFRGPGKMSIDHLIRKLFMADDIGNDVSKIFLRNPVISSTK